MVSIAVSFLIEENGQVLVVEESKPEILGKWDFPGGRIEQGETLEQAVERELKEEVGMKAESTQLIRVYEGIRDDGILGVRFQFRVKLKKGKQSEKLHEDISSNRYITRSELQELVDQHKVRAGLFHFTEICDYLKGYPEQVEIVELKDNRECPCGSNYKYKNCHFEPLLV